MTNLKLTLLAVAAFGTVSIGGASAMPFNKTSAALGENYVQDVRVVCNQNGRCYNTRRNYRNSYRYAPSYNSYAYAPGYNNGYYGRPAYGYYGGPRVGIGLGPFGFVGF